MPMLPLTAVFDDLPDPRRNTANKHHALTNLLAIATCAVIGGAESWEAIAEYGRTKEAFFKRFLPLANGIPSHDTFNRVLAALDPVSFAGCFGRWMARVVCEAAGRRGREGGTGGPRGHVQRVPTSGHRVGHRKPANPRPGGRTGRVERDRGDPRPAPDL